MCKGQQAMIIVQSSEWEATTVAARGQQAAGEHQQTYGWHARVKMVWQNLPASKQDCIKPEAVVQLECPAKVPPFCPTPPCIPHDNSDGAEGIPPTFVNINCHT